MIAFGGTFTAGAYNLIVTLKNFGSVTMGLKTRDTNTANSSMFEMDWNIVR